jgi:hypothetical protein
LDFRKEPDACRVKLEYTEHDNIREVWISGSSEWRTTNGRCDLPKKIIQHRLLLGISSPSSLSFVADDRFQNWPGAENVDGPVKGNFIAVLTLAWCYILSAKWVEMQPPCHLSRDRDSIEPEKLVYLADQAQFGRGTMDDIASCVDVVHIDVGAISDDAARWWAAILAPETGWEAAIDWPGERYLSPWSVRVEAREHFVLWRNEATSQAREQRACKDFFPPSSTMALRYLSEFCAHHQISSQCLAALATVLLVPYQGRSHRLSLPRPHTKPRLRHALSSSPSEPVFQTQSRLLPFYISLSCNTQGIKALLHGVFYEPNVSCNLVGSWLEGALETIDAIIQQGDSVKLAAVMSRRQPRIGPIWLGAIILGIENQILRPVRAGFFAVDMLSGAWTSTSHSFIGPRQEIPSRIENLRISRADECRLLYIAHPEHCRIPVCPWEPFGDTDLQDADIEVQEHSYCNGKHCLQYENWAWELQDGRKSAADRGFIPNDWLMDTNDSAFDPLVSPQCRDRSDELEGLSEIATRSIFGWLRVNGFPLKEREIWRHPWLNIYDSDEDEIDDSDGSTDSNSGPKSNVEEWISNSLSAQLCCQRYEDQ